VKEDVSVMVMVTDDGELSIWSWLEEAWPEWDGR
jgi:hypothetical protein